MNLQLLRFIWHRLLNFNTDFDINIDSKDEFNAVISHLITIVAPFNTTVL
jgi:hypothetical protein